MPNRQLTVFVRGSSWVLLDERASELGLFRSEDDALQSAVDHVRALAEPRYVIVQNEEGWRETLLAPGD
ncbi:MAG TPA: hypothetical protein VIO94_01400 [Phenylobacterium sp.]